MKAASAGLIAHLGQETTTLAWCWKVTRADAQVYGFTSHDRDLVLSGVTYAADTGLAGSAAQARAGASVDNMDVSGFLDSAAITEADLLAGIWDGAAIEVMLVNWADLTQGVLIVQTGSLGNISLSGLQFTAELRSLSQALNNTVGRTMTRRCNATLGDARCGVSLGAYTVSGTVTADSGDAQTFAASDLPASLGGLLTWTGGANAGRAMEVKQASGGQIVLVLPMPDAIVSGDAYSVSAGCDKNLSTCRDIYANVENFRGFPFIPGPDAVAAYPDAS